MPRSALFFNTSGGNNTATGYQALFSNTSAIFNTASGTFALYSNTTGAGNTADGGHALYSNTTGASNTAVGYRAGHNATGSNNIFVGAYVEGTAVDDGVLRIGVQGTQTATYVAGISGTALPSGSLVGVDVDGHLGTLSGTALPAGPTGPQGPAGPTGAGLMPGALLLLLESDPAPAGFARFGSFAESIRDNSGHPQEMTIVIYRKL